MSFTADVSRFCKKEAPEWMNGIMRKTIFEIYNRVDLRSPVGDPDQWQIPGSAPPGYVGGRFRANWQYEYGTRSTNLVDDVDPGGTKTRAKVESKLFSAPAIGVHYLVNNSPYGQRLEDGHSHQAPRGIVTLVELEFKDIVRLASK